MFFFPYGVSGLRSSSASTKQEAIVARKNKLLTNLRFVAKQRVANQDQVIMPSWLTNTALVINKCPLS